MAGTHSMPPGLPPAHPVAELFPLMAEPELQELADDIRANGQRLPIVMHEGRILDGRNRFIACAMSATKPWVVTWDGRGSAVAFVLGSNLHRRHLTPAQKAAAAVAATPLFEAEAKVRMSAGGGDKRSAAARLQRDSVYPPDRQRDESGRAVAQAAQVTGAGIVATKRIAKVQKIAPEVFDLAMAGKVTVSEAGRIAALPAPERKKAVEKARARTAPVKTSPRAKGPKARTPKQPTHTFESVLAAARTLPAADQRRLVDTLLAELAPAPIAEATP